MDEKTRRTLTSKLSELVAARRRDILVCAVCGDMIRGLGINDQPMKFTVDRVVDDKNRLLSLTCHSGKCHDIIINTRLWKDLPPGPLRSLFEREVFKTKVMRAAAKS